MEKIVKEWAIDFPWGKVAMVSWGDPTKSPILLVHGYMDSAATFIPLVEQLPDDYYYVSFDLPGHGKSDPFPPGLMISQIHIVEVVRGVVKEMKWKTFIYLSHSMGFIIGVFYNYLYPGKIRKMIHVDPALPVSGYHYLQKDPSFVYQYFQDTFYSNYERYNAPNNRVITKDEAINLLVNNRGMTEEQAEVVLSRSLIPIGDKYKLSWDTKMKKILTISISEEILYTIITKNSPKTLVLEASENRAVGASRRFAENIFEKCRLFVPKFYKIVINGGHDIHITNTETVGNYVKDFLKGKKIRTVKSKL